MTLGDENYERLKDIHIPKNIFDFVHDRYGAAIVISINSVDAINGYGQVLIHGIEVKMLHRRCYRCGYDDILYQGPQTRGERWNKCARHRYSPQEYTNIFAWIEHRVPEKSKSAEECFEEWKKIQERHPYDGYESIIYNEPEGDTE